MLSHRADLKRLQLATLTEGRNPKEPASVCLSKIPNQVPAKSNTANGRDQIRIKHRYFRFPLTDQPPKTFRTISKHYVQKLILNTVFR